MSERAEKRSLGPHAERLFSWILNIALTAGVVAAMYILVEALSG